MSDMIEVAKATVTIIPNMQGAQQSITQQLTGATSPAGIAAGNSAGGGILSGISTKLGGLKGVMAKVLPAATVAAVGKGLFEVGEYFDDMYDTIAIKTGATGEALDSLKVSSKNVFSNLPVDAEEAGEAIGEVNTRFGLTGEALEDLSGKYIKFSKLNGVDLTTAIDSTQKAMAALGVSTDDAGVFLDTLNAVGQQSGIDMNTLSQQLTDNAAVFEDMGMSASDAAVFLGMVEKSGIKSTTAMTGLKKAMVNAAKDGKTTGEALSELQELMNSGASEQEKLNAAVELFGTRSGPAMYNALKDGTLSFDDLGTSMNDFEGNLSSTMEETMSFSERVEVLKNKMLALLEPMGSAVFDALGKAVGFISSQFDKFIKGPGTKIRGVFSAIHKVVTQTGKAFTNAFKKTGVINSMSKALKNAKTAINAVWNAIKPVVSIFGRLLKTIIPPLARVLGTVLGAAFKTVSRIIGTVSGAITKLSGKISSIRTKFTSFFSSVKEKAGAFKEKLVGVFDGIREKFAAFKEKVTAPFSFLSNLKLPHLSVSAGKAPWGICGLGEKPSFSVQWYAKGGIVDDPTLIGAGEDGKEAILPLERHTEWIGDLADKINEQMNGNVTMNIYAPAGMDVKELADEVERRLINSANRRRTAWA